MFRQHCYVLVPSSALRVGRGGAVRETVVRTGRLNRGGRLLTLWIELLMLWAFMAVRSCEGPNRG